MNEGNRAKNPEVEEAALCSMLLQHGSVAIAGLLKMIHTSKCDRLRVTAINMLLELGYGRAPRPGDIEDRDPPPLPAFSNDLPAEERVVQYQKLKEVVARGLAYHEFGQQA